MMKRFMKTKSINVKLVNDQDAGATEELDPDQAWANVEIAAAYAEIAKDLVTHTALTVGGVWAACKIIGRICK